KGGKLLKVVCIAKTKPIAYSLDEPTQGTLGVRFTSGAKTYCATFGGDKTVDSGTDPPNPKGKGRFKSKNATAAPCPSPPSPCPRGGPVSRRGRGEGQSHAPPRPSAAPHPPWSRARHRATRSRRR